VSIRQKFDRFSYHYRQDAAKRQIAGIKFTYRPKIRFFARRGDSLHRFMLNLSGPTGTWVCVAEQNFTSIATGVGMRPQNIKNFHFLVKSSPRRGDSLNRFLKLLGAFIRPTIVHQWFKYNVIRFTVYGVIAEKPRVGQLGRFFPCTM